MKYQEKHPLYKVGITEYCQDSLCYYIFYIKPESLTNTLQMLEGPRFIIDDPVLVEAVLLPELTKAGFAQVEGETERHFIIGNS